MDLYAKAKNLGIQTEYIDGQGHRRVTDAGGTENHPRCPAGRRHRAGSSTSRWWSAPASPRGPSLRHAATFPLRWKIVARRLRLSPRARPRIAPSSGRRICRWALPAAPDRCRAVHRRSAADRRAGTGVRRRFRPLLAAGGAALWRPLGAQLGDRGFHRSRRADRACRTIWGPTASASIRCMRCSTTGPAIAVPIRRTAGCFSIHSISTSKNSRNFRADAESKGCAGAAAGQRHRRLSAVAGLKWQALRSAFDTFKADPEARAAAGFRKIPHRARAAAVAVCLFRGAAAQIQQALVGMAGRVATA